jgi:Protein of unknown function DUF104
MKIVIQAVFENGVFRPLAPVENLQEHDTVLLTIVPDAKALGDGLCAKAPIAANAGIGFDEPGVTPELLQEVRNSIQTALSNVRDPKVMRQAAERMDQAREELYQKIGLVDVAVPILREIRDAE